MEEAGSSVAVGRPWSLWKQKGQASFGIQEIGDLLSVDVCWLAEFLIGLCFVWVSVRLSKIIGVWQLCQVSDHFWVISSRTVFRRVSKHWRSACPTRVWYTEVPLKPLWYYEVSTRNHPKHFIIKPSTALPSWIFSLFFFFSFSEDTTTGLRTTPSQSEKQETGEEKSDGVRIVDTISKSWQNRRAEVPCLRFFFLKDRLLGFSWVVLIIWRFSMFLLEHVVNSLLKGGFMGGFVFSSVMQFLSMKAFEPDGPLGLIHHALVKVKIEDPTVRCSKGRHQNQHSWT